MPLSPALRKAAILIGALDAAGADALLEQMGEAQAQRVRDAVMELGEIDPREAETVMAEFVGNKPRVAAPSNDGVELGGSLAQMATTTSGPSPALARPAKPFAFLQEATAETVARYLKREHPQTVAVVLANLSPPRAATIASHLPTEMQIDVLARVGEIDDLPPEVLREVEKGLEAVLARELHIARRRGNGKAALDAILNAASDAGEKLSVAESKPVTPATVRHAAPIKPVTVLPRRRSELPRTIGNVAAPSVEFAQLAQLDDRDWAKVLSAADPQIGLMALAGAAPQLVERLLSQLSPTDARLLQRKMETLGPLRLRDIEAAQQQVARIAAQLGARGEIRLPRPRPFATAA